MSYWGSGFPEYVPVAEKRAKAAKKLKELSKKNPNLKPVLLQGTTIARTWWGKAWNRNLESYADYHNRIGRGRSYVRHGAVLDLQIEPGEARALVQGSQSNPYSVVISIKKLNGAVWKSILEQCQGLLESLQELIIGNFPKSIGEIFTHRDSGMFPSPKEIAFECSCPDWAVMCKHVAAALYGIGARLDENPGLFFRMRHVDMNALIRQAVTGSKEKMLSKVSSSGLRKGSRIMDGADLAATFGIDLDGEMAASSASPDKMAPSPAGRSRKKVLKGKGKLPETKLSRVGASKVTKKAPGKKTAARKKITEKAKTTLERQKSVPRKKAKPG